MKNKLLKSLMVASLLAPAGAFAQKPPGGPPMPPPGPGAPMPPMPPMPPGPPGPGMHGGMGMHAPPGIPPQLAQKLGIPPETVKKVRDLSFDANEQLIGLEADLKRAQLELEKALTATTVDENVVMAKLDVVGKAELAVRKNRMGLMLKIRKLLGQETWEKLQGEMPPPEHMMGGGGPGMRREVRVIRTPDGRETWDVQE